MLREAAEEVDENLRRSERSARVGDIEEEKEKETKISSRDGGTVKEATMDTGL